MYKILEKIKKNKFAEMKEEISNGTKKENPTVAIAKGCYQRANCEKFGDKY